METFDPIEARTVEPNDQILINGVDPVEVSQKNDLGAVIKIEGWSWNSGDTVVYFLDPFAEVAQWRA